MEARTRFTLAATLALALLALGALGSTPALAQENATATPTGEDADEPANASDAVVYVDDSVRVLDYSYDDQREMFRVVLENEGDTTHQVTITEVIQARDEASGSMGVQMLSMSPGERTVEVPVKRTDGTAAVMIVTRESLERGEGTFLRVGGEAPSIFTGEATWDYVRVAGFGGAGGTILLAILLGWHRVADSKDSVEVRL